MFSQRQKRDLAEIIEKALLELEHPEMPTEKPIFHLHVVGNSSMSWADIKPNWEFDERNEERGTKVKRALKVV